MPKVADKKKVPVPVKKPAPKPAPKAAPKIVVASKPAPKVAVAPKPAPLPVMRVVPAPPRVTPEQVAARRKQAEAAAKDQAAMKKNRIENAVASLAAHIRLLQDRKKLLEEHLKTL